MGERSCKIVDCVEESQTRGLCSKHYNRWIRYGTPYYASKFFDPEETFQVNTIWKGDCLIWTGRKNDDGYGVMKIAGKAIGAHRYAWEREHGTIPKEPRREVDHKCHTPACVNKNHLRLATPGQNNSNLKGLTKANTTGHRNVSLLPNGKYRVLVKNKHFGCYSDLEEAAKIAEQARLELFGEFAGRG